MPAGASEQGHHRRSVDFQTRSVTGRGHAGAFMLSAHAQTLAVSDAQIGARRVRLDVSGFVESGLAASRALAKLRAHRWRQLGAPCGPKAHSARPTHVNLLFATGDKLRAARAPHRRAGVSAICTCAHMARIPLGLRTVLTSCGRQLHAEVLGALSLRWAHAQAHLASSSTAYSACWARTSRALRCRPHTAPAARLLGDGGPSTDWAAVLGAEGADDEVPVRAYADADALGAAWRKPESSVLALLSEADLRDEMISTAARKGELGRRLLAEEPKSSECVKAVDR